MQLLLFRLNSAQLNTPSPCPNIFTSNRNYSSLHLLILDTYCMISQRSNSIKDLISSEPWILFGWVDGDEWASDGEDGIRVPPNRVTCQWDRGDWCWSNIEESSEQSQGATSHSGVRELGLQGLCPLGPFIKFSDFSGHLVFVFCILLLYLRPRVDAFDLI